jgi:6-pyruvoyltetrahydropterin/6-carboxytetrahydropterin synthase
MVYLTRREHFNAAHKIYCKHWDEEKNKAVFGKCANANWHGHNYDLFVTVKGTPDPETGFIINAKELGALIQDQIIEKLDHKNLNLDVDFGKEIQPTTENMCIWIWDELAKHLPAGMLYKVKLQETENIFAEYFGESTI